ncbi:MAG: 16S rRNA (guanine(527)-N(7))-methyltransferase RsmG [Thermoleophilia bacterium]
MSWQEQICSDFGISSARVALFEKLLELLIGISDRNLTAVTTADLIVNVHFRDSLSLLSFAELETADSVVDIGSGAGFPGLPLAIACPDKSFSLLEANNKKCDFLTAAIKTLCLSNVEIAAVRSEDAGRSTMRDYFDLALARAVGPLAVVLEYTLPLLTVGGAALLQRGAREEGDEQISREIAVILGGELVSVSPVKPYQGSRNLHVWRFLKTLPTPERFPRRPGMAKKRPLRP